MPQIKKAKGGAHTEEWNEDDCESAADLDAKTVDIQRFNDNWVRYLKWEVWTKTRLYDVAIFEKDQQDDEAVGESEEDDDDGDSDSDDEDKAVSTAGEGRPSNKRAATEDSPSEDSTKRARHE